MNRLETYSRAHYADGVDYTRPPLLQPADAAWVKAQLAAPKPAEDTPGFSDN